jgi:hypothetical protein
MVDKDFNIKIKETGSDGVVSAFDRIDQAADDAGKSVTDLGNKATQSGSKMAKLGETLKAGAGAAAGAAAGSVGLATALNSNMSPAASKAVGSLTAFAGVAAAFGPAGQIVSVGASLAAAAIAIFSDNAEEAIEDSRSLAQQWREDGAAGSFFAQSLGQMAAAFEDAAEKANTLQSAYDLLGGKAKALTLDPAVVQKGIDLQKQQADQIKRIDDLTANIAAQEQKILTTRESMLPWDAFSNLDKSNADLEVSRDILAEVNHELENLNQKPADVVTKAATASGKSAGKAAGESWVLAYQDAIDQGLAAARTSTQASQDEETFGLHQGPVTPEWQIAYYDELDQRRRESADSFAAGRSEEQALLHQAKGDYDDFAATIGGKAVDALEAFGSGFAQTAAAAIAAGESFKEVANAALEALATQALGEAAFQFAKGLAYTAANFFFPSPNLSAAAATAFASAAAFGAIGGIAAAATAATGGGSSGGGGGSSEGGGGGVQSSRDLGPSGGNGGGGPVVNNYIIENTGVLGLSTQLARTFAEGTRQQNIRQGGIKTNTRRN